jgi:hypothetical protein
LLYLTLVSAPSVLNQRVWQRGVFVFWKPKRIGKHG